MILLLFSLSFNFAVASHDLGGGVRVTPSQVQAIEQQLPRTTQAKAYYHWTSFETGMRWQAQRQLNAGEVAFYNKPTGQLQAYGPGLYFSENPTDSKVFGALRMQFEIAAGTYIYDQQVVQKVIGKSLNDTQMAKLGEVIPFIRKLTQTWYVGNHPNHFRNISIGAIQGDSFINWTRGSKSYELERALQEAGKRDGRFMHLESLLQLSIYMDGISFYRALKVNPQNPWAEFEPHNFERFRKARQDFIAKQLSEQKLGIARGSNQNVGSWAQIQVEQILPQIHRQVSGDGSEPWRLEGIRAGGDREGKTFQVTPEQLMELKANPYLTVESKPLSNGNHLVSYHYPDVFHVEKVMSRLSPQLQNTLKSTSRERLWQDSNLRQSLNRRIIRELLTESFTRLGAQNTEAHLKSVEMLRELVSIHPFTDFNGRSLRLYSEMGNVEMKLEVPYSFLNDLDILTSKEKYAELLRAGTNARNVLIEALLAELSLAVKENRNPQFHRVKGLNEFFKALEPLGIRVPNRELNQRELDLIRRRDFQQFFEEIGRLKIVGNCRSVFL